MKQSMITSEENLLAGRVGRENPFRVPEGYFDALPAQVMGRIAQRRQRRRLWRWAAAAVMAGCVCTAGFLMMNGSNNLLAGNDSAYMEDELDYSMLNNLEIQQYLTIAE